MYVALSNLLYHWESGTKYGAWPYTMDVQLVTSRDGVHWNRAPERRPFIRLGPRGTFWSKTLWPSGNVIRMGDELWIYLSGHDVAHNQEQNKVKGKGTYTLAKLRLDGFISADASYTGGELITMPLVFDGKSLQLNVDTSAGGVVRVEILDSSGEPVPGFAAADCNEINGNYIRVPVTWKGNPDVSALASKPVQLRFVMRDCRLYAFKFIP